VLAIWVKASVVENKISQPPDADLGYGQILAILWRRGFWFLGVFGAVVAASLIATKLEKPTYQSSMQLLVEPNYEQRQQTLGVDDQAQASESKQDYVTQLNLMRSSQFIQKTVESLRSQYPNLTARSVDLSLQLTQVVEGGEETKIFRAIYISDDPDKTREVLEALQKVYQEYNSQQRELRLNRGLASIDQQLQDARQDLITSQGSLERFLSGNTIVEPTQQASALLDSLTKTQQARQEARAQYEETLARYTALQRQVDLSPQVALITARLSQSDRYQALLNALQATDLSIAEQSVIYRDADPNVQTLMEQRQNQVALLRQEVTRILGTTPGQSATDEDSLLNEGQLSATDLALVSELVQKQTELQGLEARNQSLAQNEQQLRAELSQYPRLIAEYQRLQPEVESERTNLQQLLALRQQLSAQLAQSGFDWQVVESPRTGRQISPDPQTNLLLGIVAGLFLGGIAAFLREVTDPIVHTPEDLEKQVALPLLGSLPKLASSPKNSPFSIAAILPAGSKGVSPNVSEKWLPLRESLDLIYKNIQLLNSNTQINSLAVTAVSPGEGKSTVAVGLAFSAARLHQRVLLIDANLRNPSLHEYFQIANDRGLVSLLLEAPSEDVHPVNIPLAGFSIDVLPAGTPPPDPVRLLSSYQMKELMLKYEESYDLVLLDTPSVLGTVDVAQIASVCQGVVLVGRLGRVLKPDLVQAVVALRNFNVTGVIANAYGRASTHGTAYTSKA
jgi:polysaccharide biosynthesis transport protein